MTDTLKRLSGPTALTNAAVTQYTVPAVTTTAIRNIHACNESAAVHDFTVSVGIDGAGKRIFKNQQIAVGDSFDWTGNIVLATTEVIQALADAGAVITLVISGIEVT